MTRNRAALARLREVAGMVFETRASALRIATDARDRVKWQIDALDRPGPLGVTGAEMLNSLAYESWAAKRRGELNIELARREAERQVKLAETQRALGRLPVLDQISARKGR